MTPKPAKPTTRKHVVRLVVHHGSRGEDAKETTVTLTLAPWEAENA